jgi:hypothetical protein
VDGDHGYDKTEVPKPAKRLRPELRGFFKINVVCRGPVNGAVRRKRGAMQVIGAVPKLPTSQHVLRIVVASVFATAVLVPWLLISVGCVIVGCLAISRNESGLIVCLPAGLAILFALPLLCYLQLTWYPRIRRFHFDGEIFRYSLCDSGDFHSRSLSDVLKVYKVKKPKRCRICGYILTFRDGSSFYISRSLVNADILYDELLRMIAGK